MNSLFVKVVLRLQQSSGLVPLLLLLVSLEIGTVGCNRSTDSANFTSGDSTAPALHPTVPDALQTQVHHQIDQFLAEVQKQDYAALQQEMTPSWRAKAPKSEAEWITQGRYQSLLGAKDWKYDLTQSMSGGKEIVVHSGYTGADGGNYRTNVILRQTGTLWQIDAILPPTKQVRPLGQKSGSTAAIPGH